MISMGFDPEKHHRRAMRLKGYDYSLPGMYFVTICVRERECALGEILNGNLYLSEFGEIAFNFWEPVTQHFPNVIIDQFIVMPNHVHAIIHICEGKKPTLNQELTEHRSSPTLGNIIGYYKYQTTKQINQIGENVGTPFWQERFYDHIIRNDEELNATREYIVSNPLKWELDIDHPDNIIK
jgi:REP element-mobilizing transposase RayT